jgi:hypothetical protein
VASSSIDPFIQPSDSNATSKFYEDFMPEGDWRDSKNRLDNGKCQFGFDDSIGQKYYCSEIYWETQEKSDGFSKRYRIFVDAVDDEYSTNLDSKLFVSCENKKLSVGIKINDAEAAGWNSTGYFRFDGNSPKKFKYRLDSNLEYLILDDPKAFTSSFMKSKSKASFKISNPESNIIVFPKSNLNRFSSKFKGMGCSLT